MNLFQALILGIIQGLTEFLPISSTAHLTLTGKLLRCVDAQHPQQWTAFIAVIQLGTALAALIYFAPDLIIIAREFLHCNIDYWHKREIILSVPARLGWQIIIGSIPILLTGFTLKKVIEGNITKNLYVIAGSLIGLAIILIFAEIYGRRLRAMEQLTILDAIIVGCAQVCALIPGASRSGATIAAALFVGLTRVAAARFSFLLSLPAIGGTGFYQFYKSYKDLAPRMYANLIVATLAAALVGYIAIGLLINFLQTHSTYIFVGYRISLGALILALIGLGKIQPQGNEQ
jgi:undecaprenyl-diphosphatase